MTSGYFQEASDLTAPILEIAERHGPLGLAAAKREAAPLQRRLNRLAKRPGRKPARAERKAQNPKSLRPG